MRQWRIGRRRRSRLHQNELESFWKRKEEGSTLLENVFICFFVRTSNHQLGELYMDDNEGMKSRSYSSNKKFIVSVVFLSALCGSCVVVVVVIWSILLLYILLNIFLANYTYVPQYIFPVNVWLILF